MQTSILLKTAVMLEELHAQTVLEIQHLQRRLIKRYAMQLAFH